jgi:hypothetical protein
MNFVQLLGSLDEFLYEVMAWLIFYPITLWRTIRHPLVMMAYADSELKDDETEQYADTLSPPLFLLLSLLLAHAIELAVVGESPVVADTRGLAGLVKDDTSLLFLRLLIFSIFPLIMAMRLVHKQGIGLNRTTLKQPFYSQCYAVAPFALLLSLAGTLIQLSHIATQFAGLGIAMAALIGFGGIQARWFAINLHQSNLRGFCNASIAMIESLLLVVLAAPLFS